MPTQVNNQRIAKNTILLYIRTLVVMCITLYTSRVILKELGVDDYGIYQAVGGFVAMFAVISSALSSSISRFITFEIGHGDQDKLKRIFSTSVNILVILALIIAVLAEIVGIWFINHKMQIPAGRETAAVWVLHASVFSFCINLISVPYNALIIAHEHMKAFAYFGLFEAIAKLIICLSIAYAPIDKLIWYAILLSILALVIRVFYSIFCRKRFEESAYHFVYDRGLFKEMAGFAGWSFISNSIYIFNTQGINLLTNVYFGVALNAARGIATQVDGAVMQFANNFSTALNPQITKSYAAKEYSSMFLLICRGAKFSVYLMLLLAIPILFETDEILILWLTTVPEHSASFVRLAIIGTIITLIGNTGTTACLATGNIKRYVIAVSAFGILAFPLTWLCFELGMSPEMAYVMYIVSYLLVDIVRLVEMKRLLGFPIILFLKEVIIRIIPVTLLAIVLPFMITALMPMSILRLALTIIASLAGTSLAVLFVGMTNHERTMIINKIKSVLCRSKAI